MNWYPFTKRLSPFNPTALKKAKVAYNFGLSECKRVKNGGKICISIHQKTISL